MVARIDDIAKNHSIVVKVWLDFVCPFCLLAKGPLQEALEGFDVGIEWMPFELRPQPMPTLRPEDEYLPDIWARSVYPMASEMGVPIKLPTISPQPYTRLAFEGFQHARRHGKEEHYVDAVLKAFFQADQDIGLVSVLSAVAGSIGLSPTDFSRDLHQGTYRQTHVAALAVARNQGIRSVPTIMVGSQHFQGVPTVAALRKALATQSTAAIKTHSSDE